MGGFQTGRVLVKSGEQYTVAIDNGTYLFYVEGYNFVPFSIEDIDQIIISHEQVNAAHYKQRQGAVARQGFLDKPANEIGISVEAQDLC